MDSNEIIKLTKESMENTLKNLEKRFATVRAGRANPSSLDGVHVEYYGSMTPLKQLATISVPEATQLLIKPFDRSCLGAIEKAILAANLGYTPNNDGETIRIVIPALTEERRRELTKQVKAIAEDAKVSVRNNRHEALEMVEEEDFPEDIEKGMEKDIQDLVNTYNKKIEEGKNIAIVSDAGTPGINDPGEEIIKKCIENDIRIVPIPGACAMINALVASGISTKEFLYYGFLPLNKKLRKEKLEEIKNTNKTVILYEAPHKLKTTLKDLEKIIENRKVVLARELTKIHEEFIRGNIKDLLEKADDLKGEMVLVIEGNEHIKEENKLNGLTLEEHYKFYEMQGLEKKEIIKKIAKDREVNKNEIYKHFLNK